MIEVKAVSRGFGEIECDALVVGVFEGEKPEAGALRDLDERVGGLVSSVIETGEFRGKTGDIAYLHQTGAMKARRLVLLGAGPEAEFTGETLRRLAGTATRLLRGKKGRSFALLLRGGLGPAASGEAATEGALLSLFEPDKYHTSEKTENPLGVMMLVGEEGHQAELEAGIGRGRIIAEAANFGREAINEPSNVLTPTELARRATEMAREVGLSIEVLGEEEMKKLGMGSLLGVSQGSAEPAQLIVLTYEPKEKTSAETIAIVGKGVTFDTGGISLKPADGMEAMKYDMAGGATAIAAMRAIAQLKPGVRVLGLVPATENMPGGRAQRPGDVVRAMTGKTIEVINTDAEGRLILADAVAYARQLGATHIIDLATLTGAVSVALGDVYVAILGNDQPWVDRVMQAAQRAGEKFWQLPLDKEYREQIKSDIADIKNIGGRKAGTITGAWFIREFVEDTPWVHLDIAGTAWNEKTKPHLAIGPTAVGLRTLVELVTG